MPKNICRSVWRACCAKTSLDIELILVDDGSTDSSPTLCDQYAAKDARVRVIHQENAGAAAARNHGLGIAQGEYVAFVDSDDWIDADMYERMFAAAELDKSELVICDCLKESTEAANFIHMRFRPAHMAVIVYVRCTIPNF